MSTGIVQIAVTLLIITILIKPAGSYLVNVFNYEKTRLDNIFRPIEKILYRIMGVREDERMGWKQYVIALLLSNFAMVMLMYAVLRLQKYLPFNPDGIDNMSSALAFNTAASFITNTNWQAYSGENGLSYLSQMLAITFPMFTSAATGLVAAIAFIRGLTAQEDSLGNFYVDLIRSLTRVFLPLSLLVALFLVFQGAPQTLNGAQTATSIEGAQQVITRGPVASLESIKHIGTNGGGYFGMNASHPFENPTPLTNLVHILCMMFIPTALVYAFGIMLKNKRQGWTLFATMAAIFLIMLSTVFLAEYKGTPALQALGISGNMEGKEVRFGYSESALFTTVTTAATTGSVNNMHDSLTPIGGLVPLAQMMLNNVFGGDGVGLMNGLLYVILTVFICGLMVGRTPEFLGKKIEGKEIKLASIALLVHPVIILVPTAIAFLRPESVASILNAGSHGISEVLYAFTSGAANNGSAFAGLSANTNFYNMAIGLVMLFGRYVSIIALLAAAGSLAAKPVAPVTIGTFRTDSPLFALILLVMIVVVGALTFFPALALGPIAEQLSMWQ
ncbi:potassium-transporting ATPase subunit KdpA [Aneurinibacillus aneurinilyticus]|jgi:K+-transporting ATPase ATPase A chain|uniref:Potassium-transporting ATPase potassium-binding subunit n=1 Tax=Aneurinibacillus aneurinilyticus ATCC 12856 TaxID=649747 RepID=U1WQS2_ANEAE|nr:potassium-transporting ATPase subunit KdpA [Aneurinibacillus aneurinilyticus]ERI10954.1 K+-transporting ATPase, A subunit [Aneurinibacillus aneurinilyticus ATCC 12856]MED0669078.1 potassium-transporting ATPase subunit KdpA [Aneurinibacillus aneurinilyticus]MED0709168.1 potassium-transporting ATPase subunit KdpA [Aneurinibacillus aneurinilyticus]MED0724144.1 potassium-transporting ATPase subunit KdpA [Aneurinibacillus aneurinilyticus]MED0735282.1 potassium-transporting ATPase subunit KdpA [A